MFVGVVVSCVVLITKCHNSYKHSQSSLTNYSAAYIATCVTLNSAKTIYQNYKKNYQPLNFLLY